MSVRSYTRTTWTRRIRVLGVSLACLLIVAAREARAQSDHSIYSDALGAGWQDWSWCVRDLNSTDFIHSETRSAKVTYTAWQGRQGSISNAFIQGGSVAAGTWRESIPLSALNADNKTNFNGFWLQDSSGGAQAAFHVDDSTAPPCLRHRKFR